MASSACQCGIRTEKSMKHGLVLGGCGVLLQAPAEGKTLQRETLGIDDGSGRYNCDGAGQACEGGRGGGCVCVCVSAVPPPAEIWPGGAKDSVTDGIQPSTPLNTCIFLKHNCTKTLQWVARL